MAYVGFVIPTAERCGCHTATEDKRRIILFILRLRAGPD